MTKAISLQAYSRPANIKPFANATREMARAKAIAPVKVIAAAADGERDAIFVYGEIGGWGVYADEFISALEQIDGEGKEIEIRLHTPGGDVFEGQAMAVAIKRAKAKTIGIVYGHAASMGSVLLAACDERRAYSNSLVMIHAPEAVVGGNAQQIRAGSDLLDTIREVFAGLYAESTGADLEKARGWMEYGQDTWFTALDAAAENIIDTIIDAKFVATGSMTASVAAEREIPAEILEVLESQVESAEGEGETAVEAGDAAPAVIPDQGTCAAEPQKDEPAELAAEAQEAIRAACVTARMPDQAAGFIAARASIDIVRARLFDAMAAADAQIETSTIRPAASDAPAQKTAAQISAERRAAQHSKFH